MDEFVNVNNREVEGKKLKTLNIDSDFEEDNPEEPAQQKIEQNQEAKDEALRGHHRRAQSPEKQKSSKLKSSQRRPHSSLGQPQARKTTQS